MALAVVQSVSFNAAWSGSFGANVTAGNTVFLLAYQYNNTGATMSSSSPVFGGSPASGASLITSGQPSGSAVVYGVIWMLPDLAGGAASVGLTNSGGTVDTNVGMAAVEVSGLGASPALDTTATNPAPATGSSGNPASGTTSATAEAPDFIIAFAVEYGTALTAPGAPWLAPTGGQPASGCLAGWQIATSAGGTYSYSATGSGQRWAASVAAIAVTSGAAPQQPPFLYVMRRV
jgi:hypothetical protein